MDKKEHHAAWKREWRRKNPDKVKAQTAKHTAYMREYYKTYYPKNRIEISRKQRETRQKRLKFIFDFFGGKCVGCGITDIRVMQLDHTHGRNGEKRLGNVDSRYAFVKNHPKEAREKYQPLCSNCNHIKSIEKGEHRKSKYG